MGVEMPKVSPERAEAVFKTTNEVLRATLSGDKKRIKKAYQRWELILDKDERFSRPE